MIVANKIDWIKIFQLIQFILTSKFPVLVSVIFLLRLDNLASKSVFVIKLACANLALKTSAANISNSEVSIYLSWLSLFSIQ